MYSFAPCPSCQRHVRLADAACPFCGAVAVAPRVARSGPVSTERVGRAAIFALGISLAACGGGDATSSSAASAGPAADPSAGGATTTTTTTTTTSDTPATAGAQDASDAGAPTSGPPGDNGSIVAMYGMAVAIQPTDAGAADAAPPPEPAHHGHATHGHHAPAEQTVAAPYGAPPTH